jgi:ATP-dependent protease ClpP protease subunit
MANRKVTCTMLSQACGKPYDVVEKDASRTFYMTPDEAVTYGLIDRVLTNTKKDNAPKPKFLGMYDMCKINLCVAKT